MLSLKAVTPDDERDAYLMVVIQMLSLMTEIQVLSLMTVIKVLDVKTVIQMPNHNTRCLM
jgi:hypothetical protein